MDVITIFVILGTISFAISGALSAMAKQMDVFGVFIIAFVTALGGGTTRDILVGQIPVFWMKDVSFIYLILIGTVLALVFRNSIKKFRKTLFMFDTIGLGIFTIAGVQIGINEGLHPIICIILGTITGSFGGVLRDVLSNQTPLIFHKEIYATVSLFGGGLYLVFMHFESTHNWAYVVTSLFVILLRLIVTKYQLSIPKWY